MAPSIPLKGLLHSFTSIQILPHNFYFHSLNFFFSFPFWTGGKEGLSWKLKRVSFYSFLFCFFFSFLVREYQTHYVGCIVFVFVFVFVCESIRLRRGMRESEILKAKCHYRQANVDGVIYKLYDDAYVKVSHLCFLFVF